MKLGENGILAVGDTIRPHPADALRAIHAAGVDVAARKCWPRCAGWPHPKPSYLATRSES